MTDNDKLISDLAIEYKLQYEYVYPKNRKKTDKSVLALTGFDDFKRAKKIAEKYDLSIEILYKRDCTSNWERTGKIAEKCFHRGVREIRKNIDDFDDSYKFYKYGDEDTFYAKEVRPQLKKFDNFEDINDFLLVMEELEDGICSLSAGQILIAKDNEVYDVVNEECMQYEDNKGMHLIGLLVRE